MGPNLPFCLLLLLIIFCLDLPAQKISDSEMVLTHDFTDSVMVQKRQVSFGISKSGSAFIKYNPVTLVFSGLMFTYQKWVSPQISAECLYSPSCSEYSKLLFRKYGIFKGLFTSADRIMRCDRISATTLSPFSINEKDGKVHEGVLRYQINSK